MAGGSHEAIRRQGMLKQIVRPSQELMGYSVAMLGHVSMDERCIA